MARSCTHDSVSLIGPRFNSFVEDFVLLLLSSHQTLLLVEKIPFQYLRKWVWIQFFLFCIPTFEAPPSESEISLSEECASTCISRSSRSSVKRCSQTRMPCVGSSLFLSSEKMCVLGHGFFVACLSGTVSIGFPHACLSLRVVTGSDKSPNFLELFDWSVDLDVEDELCCWNMMTVLVRQEVRSCPLPFFK